MHMESVSSYLTQMVHTHPSALPHTATLFRGWFQNTEKPGFFFFKSQSVQQEDTNPSQLLNICFYNGIKLPGKTGLRRTCLNI
jgi:hypothetical protein